MMFIRKYLVCQVVIVLLASSAMAQEKADSVLKFSLTEAQAYALQNNKSILNANLDVESAKKKVWETTAIGLPQVSAKVAYSYSPELSPIVAQFVGPGVDLDDLKWGLTGTVTATQLIFSGSYLVGLQSAKVYKSLSELNRIKSTEDVLESVTNSYFNLLIARENKQILDSTYNNLLKVFEDMKAMGKQGFVEETDIDQMQITVSRVKTSLDMITRLEGVAERLLKLQLGIEFEKSLELTENLNTLIQVLSYEQLLLADFVLENNVNYKMLDASVKASELMLKLRKSEFLPDLAAFYQYQKEFNDKGFTFTPPHAIGVQLNIPIFGSGMKLAKVSQARIDLKKAENTRSQASDGLKVEYFSSRSALMSSVDNYKTETVNLQLSKKIYDKGLIKYTNGVISSTDLTQIQNQYLQSQSAYYTALQSLIESKAKLEKLLTQGK